MINTVETYDGSVANKRDCRFIKGDFYIKNKQCFLIDNTWYRINSGFITFDYEKKSWVITKDNPQLIKGIVGYDDNKNDFILGMYSPNRYNNVNVRLLNGNSYNCVNYKLLPSDLFIEDPITQEFVHHTMSKRIGNGISNINFSNNGYPFDLPYCTKHYAPEIASLFKDNISIGRAKTNIASYINQIGDYSFGVEFETMRGKIPNYKILQTGLMPLRDGSITGIEFATIPLSGKRGINILENACMELKKYTTFSENESLHLHIGNTQNTKKYIGYLYTICSLLEDEIFSMFPAWYAQTSKFKARGKDYNMPLRKELVAMTPEETFSNIAFYLSEGKKYQGMGSNHPSDPGDEHKWQVQARYHWVNFIPLLFGTNKTIEFRCHVPTNDPVKVINWLYICSAILKYTEKISKNNENVLTLKNLMLNDILADVYDIRLSMYLIGYIRDRKYNRKNDEKNGDRVGTTEISAELRNIVLYKDIE